MARNEEKLCSTSLKPIFRLIPITRNRIFLGTRSSFTTTYFLNIFFLNHRYTGVLLLTAGILTQCIIGPIPDICENCCCCGIGPCIGAILSSILAKLTLAFITLVLALCNFLGYFWIYMAAKSRTTENSQSPGSPNYCPPEIWYTAHVTVYGLFLVFVVLIFRLFASIYWNFILTEEKKHGFVPMYFGPSSKNPLKKPRDPSRLV